MPIAPDDTKAPVKRSASSIKTPPEPKTFGYRPNVVGGFGSFGADNNAGGFGFATAGFIQTRSLPVTGWVSGDYGAVCDYDLSAQRCSAIFGTSQRVQPAACQLLMIIKD